MHKMEGAQENAPAEEEVPLVGEYEVKTVVKEEEKAKPEKIHWILNGKDTLVCVDSFNKNIWWELKYATKDNFMHRVLYDTMQKVYVQIDVARRLAKAQEYLTGRNKDFHLLVYDGVRRETEVFTTTELLWTLQFVMRNENPWIWEQDMMISGKLLIRRWNQNFWQQEKLHSNRLITGKCCGEP